MIRPNARSARWSRRATALYRALFVMYPRDFSRRYGHELVKAFHDATMDAYDERGWGGIAGVWLRMFTELIASAPREHLAASNRRRWARRFDHPPRGAFMHIMFQDVGYALRTLRKNPVFAFVVIATLALGIGANSAIFSVVYGVALRPLPYAEPDRLVWLSMAFTGHDGQPSEFPASEPEYVEYRDQSTAFEDVAGFLNWTFRVNLGGMDQPQRVPAASVTANFLDLLGVVPVVGRSFVAGEDRPGAEPVVMLGHGLWQRSFGGDSGVVGRSVVIDGEPVTVIGVMPRSFAFPGRDVDLIVMNTIDPQNLGRRSSHYLAMIGRLREGATVIAARAEISALLARWTSEFPGRHGPSERHPILAVGLHDRVVGDVRTTLLILAGAVSLVLLIACANVASLMLARAETRHREIGIRTALGAGRRRLIAQVLTESGVVAVVGGLGGLTLAVIGVRLLALGGPADLPRLHAVRVDGAVLLFTAVVTVVTGLLFGIVPALSTARRDVQTMFKEGSAASTAGTGRMTFRRMLVVTEVGLAVVLVIGAGLLMKSFARLQRVDPGFSGEGVITMDFSLPAAVYPTQVDVAAFHAELVERVKALPSVVAAGAIRVLPLRGAPGTESLTLVGAVGGEDGPGTRSGPAWNAQLQVAGPGYFAALAIPLRAGRGFTAADRAGASPVVIVNESMARAFWPDGDALGKQVRAGPDGTGHPFMTIVGIVGDVRQSGLDGGPTSQFFVPRQQAGVIYNGFATRGATFVVRTESAPRAATSGIRSIIRQIDPSLPLANVQTMERVLARSVSDERFMSGVMAVFSAVALLLGAVGIYGLMAYSVAQRTREIGLRMALGATRQRVLRHVVQQGMVMTAVGIGLGIAGAVAASRVVSGLMFEVSVRDPAVFVGAPALLLLVSLVAAYIPARRAATVDPMVALRTEQ